MKTADGREIRFALDLSFRRTQVTESRTSLRIGPPEPPPTDPLVLNFDGPAAALTDTRFAFDLDSDGKSESLPGLSSGSGYLALDRNGDGKIGDGSELFGPKSGDGFADLAAHDLDGNGWIDSRDKIFGLLRVWRPGANGGAGTLRTLEQAGVGAIHLGSVAAPFDFRGADPLVGGRLAARKSENTRSVFPRRRKPRRRPADRSRGVTLENGD